MISKVLLVLLQLSWAAHADECAVWFEKSGIEKVDPDCELKCSVAGTSMGTFMCPQLCKKFCGKTPVSDTLIGPLLYYPGLTSEERKLVNQFPKEALVVFVQKQKAESATVRMFSRDAEDDESDAFRHFVWAGLLAKELGTERAKVFLDAHESQGDRSSPNRAMDLANNRAGLLTADRLRREGKLSQESLETAAGEGIKKGELVILKPTGVKR